MTKKYLKELSKKLCVHKQKETETLNWVLKENGITHKYLNIPFDNSIEHYIDSTTVVFIPYKIHRKYPHDHNRPNSLVLINKAIEKWLKK